METQDGLNNSISASSVPTTDSTPNQISQNPKKRLFLFGTIVVFAFLIMVGVIMYLLKPETPTNKGTQKPEETETQALFPMEPLTSINQNNLLAYIQEDDENSVLHIFDTLTGTPVQFEGSFECEGNCSVAHMTDWSPTGDLLGIFLVDEQSASVYAYKYSENKLKKIFSEEKEGIFWGNIGEIIIFPGITFWTNDNMLQVTNGIIIDFEKEELSKLPIDTKIPVPSNDFTLVENFKDRIHENVTVTKYTDGDFLSRYEVTINGNTLELDYQPVGIVNNYLVSFEPSRNNLLEGLENLINTDEITEDSSEEEIQQAIDELYSPKNDAVVEFRNTTSPTEKTELIIENDGKWHNVHSFPIPNSEDILILQDTDPELPVENSTRFLKTSLNNKEEQIVFYDHPPGSYVSGKKVLPISPSLNAYGNYLMYGISYTESDKNIKSNGLQVEILNLKTKETKTVCDSNCKFAKLYSPSSFYMISYYHIEK